MTETTQKTRENSSHLHNIPVPYRLAEPLPAMSSHGGVGDQCPAGCLVYRPAKVAPSGGARCPAHVNLPLVPAAVALS